MEKSEQEIKVVELEEVEEIEIKPTYPPLKPNGDEPV